MFFYFYLVNQTQYKYRWLHGHLLISHYTNVQQVKFSLMGLKKQKKKKSCKINLFESLRKYKKYKV